jgi:hypothetical protein
VREVAERGRAAAAGLSSRGSGERRGGMRRENQRRPAKWPDTTREGGSRAASGTRHALMLRIEVHSPSVGSSSAPSPGPASSTPRPPRRARRRDGSSPLPGHDQAHGPRSHAKATSTRQGSEASVEAGAGDAFQPCHPSLRRLHGKFRFPAPAAPPRCGSETASCAGLP